MSQSDAFQQVRSAIVLSDYVTQALGAQLSPRGLGRFSGACPVHGGDNKSAFTVDDTRGLWHCFSQCGSGGDIFDLWMRTNASTSKKDALVALAAYAGVTLPEVSRPVLERDVLKALRRAAWFFAGILMDTDDLDSDLRSEASGQQAYEWLTQARGLNESHLVEAQIGFVPDVRTLRDELKTHVAPERVLLAAGILRQSKTSGRIYCPYAGRVTFPIRNGDGDVVGFGARLVPGVTRNEDEQPKFVNTDQTDVYDKSAVLYGIERVDDSTKVVYVCEGYLDAIAVTTEGASSGSVGVAACGTSITRRQLELIEKTMGPRGRVVFLMDADVAGAKATSRLLTALSIFGSRASSLTLGDQYGKDAWDAHVSGLLNEALSTSREAGLLDAIVGAARSSRPSDEDFDSWVSDSFASVSADIADQLLRASARARGVPVSTYGEILRRHEIRTSAFRNQDTERLLSAPARSLAVSLLALDPAELRGVGGALRAFSTEAEARDFVRRWMPVDREIDTDALLYVLDPVRFPAEAETLKAVAACLPDPDSRTRPGPASPSVHGLAMVLLSEGAKLAHEVRSPALLSRLRGVRDIAHSDISDEVWPSATAFLLEVAHDLDFEASR